MEPDSSTWRQSTASDGSLSVHDDHLIADGPLHPSQAPQAPELPTSTSCTRPTSKALADTDRPLSPCKNPQVHDPLTLRDDGSTAAGRLHPAIRASSPTSGAFMLPEGPYQGPVSPSHPYSMYPQRTTTNASSPTAPNITATAPAHNYALYTQTIGDDATDVELTGLCNAYQRQISPQDTETGDLLGTMGSMEQLPAYTRYPEGSSARPPLETVHSATSARGTNVISGAGGLGRATRDPEFSSAEDDLPAASSSHPATPGETASQHEINTAARDFSEKTALGNWQRRAKKKLCGVVPCWALGLFVAAVVVIAVVVGAVVGTLLSNKVKSDGHADSQAASREPASDIEPLPAVPANLASLATGAFCIPRLDISQAPKSCFNDPKQAQAWSCNMMSRSYAMTVSRVAEAPDTKGYNLSLMARNFSNSKFYYGTQPPDISSPRPLQLVNDAFERNRGPAWWMLINYNKTVVVAQENFPPLPDSSSPRIKRYPQMSRGAQRDDRPWICTWPDTTLEIFIYPSQNISLGDLPYDGDVPAPESSYDKMLSYPMVVKFLERRWHDDGTPAAHCRQIEITENGERDVVDEDGNPVEVIIDESVRDNSERVAQHERGRHPNEDRGSKKRIVAREALELTDCGCLWWST
ncbi:proteinrelated to glucan 1, 4-alpha-glucosidase [Ophiocordyceps camponoti-floridani]|uniref:Proteinrelated to glucan 1, 4-alpha-glucosidase n=1 Tax=Ophiocordyceps camponoti-floridani TaxID=2030778 RepID=A0A8H4QE91_9HYPO|nr:proteinrelated to glucan 1, 4-alpha-glucosidase [Ophiocordyceps camponoti-floridani]